MVAFFYVLTFIFFAPIGVYALGTHRPIKNKFLFVFVAILFCLKTFIDCIGLVALTLEKNIGALIYFLSVIVILVLFYKRLYGNNKQKEAKVINAQYTDISEKKESNLAYNNDNKIVDSVDVKHESISEISPYIEDTEIEENINEISTYIEDLETSEAYGTIEELKAVIRDLQGTGEIFTFYYKKSSFPEPELRNVVVLKLYSKDEHDYIYCIDIDNDNIRKTFRVDRITSYLSNDIPDDKVENDEELVCEVENNSDSNTKTPLEIEFAKINPEVLKDVQSFLDTKEPFEFTYKTLDNEKSYKVLILEAYNDDVTYYIKCKDLSDGSVKTFELKYVISFLQKYREMTVEQKNEIEQEYNKLYESQQFIEATNRIIEKLTNELNVLSPPSQNLDLKAILKEQGFILKKGRSSHIYNKNFAYIGTLNITIIKIEKMFPGLFGVSPFGILEYNQDLNEISSSKNCELYTYSKEIIEKVSNYNPKAYLDLKKEVEYILSTNKNNIVVEE